MVIRVEAPQDKGFAILSPLLFNSEAWLTALTRDSTRLISTASQAIVTASAAAAEEEEEDGKKKAPFELFEEVWYELGWHRVHLFGVCSGPSRVAWGASLARSFLSWLRPGIERTQQVCALFALYCFLCSSPPSLEPVYAYLDPDTMDYIIDLPQSLGLALPSSVNPTDALIDPALRDTDPAPSTGAPETQAQQQHEVQEQLLSGDLLFALRELVSSQVLLLVPARSSLSPNGASPSLCSPQVIAATATDDRVQPAHREPLVRESMPDTLTAGVRPAKLVLGIERELDAFGALVNSNDDGDGDEMARQGQWQGLQSDMLGVDPATMDQLRQLQASYIDRKRGATAQVATTTLDEGADGPSARATKKRLLDLANAQQVHILKTLANDTGLVAGVLDSDEHRDLLTLVGDDEQPDPAGPTTTFE